MTLAEKDACDDRCRASTCSEVNMTWVRPEALMGTCIHFVRIQRDTHKRLYNFPTSYEYRLIQDQFPNCY